MYRLGKKQKRAILTEDGKEVVVFPRGKEKMAERVCFLLNKDLEEMVSPEARAAAGARIGPRAEGRSNLKGTKLLLDFIIEQELDLEEYPNLEAPLREKFNISKDGQEATKELVEFVIEWENNTGIYSPLESLINQTFVITKK